MAEEEKEEAQQPKGGGGMQKILILALLLCNVLSLGGLAAFVMLGGSSSSEAAAEPAAEAMLDDKKSEGDTKGGEEKKTDDGESKEAKEGEDGDEEASATDLGPTVKLGSFVINLNDPGHPRYLKVALKAEVSVTEAKNEIRARDPQVRDIVISYLSSLALKETYGARAKATIRDNLQRRINHILTTGEVTKVFFTDFMTQ